MLPSGNAHHSIKSVVITGDNREDLQLLNTNIQSQFIIATRSTNKHDCTRKQTFLKNEQRMTSSDVTLLVLLIALPHWVRVTSVIHRDKGSTGVVHHYIVLNAEIVLLVRCSLKIALNNRDCLGASGI